MKFATVITLVSAIAKANGKSQHALRRRGLVEEEMPIAMLDTNKHNSNSKSGETEGSSDEPDVDVCNINLIKFAGLWSAVDMKDGSHVQASIQCFKDECGCKVIFSDDYVFGCSGNVLVSTQATIYDADSNTLKDDGDLGYECFQGFNANVAPNPSSSSNIISYTLQDDGSLVTMVDPIFDIFPGLNFFTAFNGFTFWRVSQSVDTLPRRPPPPPAPPAVIANNDSVSVPTGFVGSKGINVLENDVTDPEGIALEVVAIVAQPDEGKGFCTIPHDDNKVVEYYYPPDSPSFGGASCTYRVCPVPSADVPQIVCDTARVDITPAATQCIGAGNSCGNGNGECCGELSCIGEICFVPL